MSTEKREYPRITTKGIPTTITITSEKGATIFADANILDISQTGIRLYLQKPLPTYADEPFEMEIVLPKSGKPLFINANIVHSEAGSEIGAVYVEIESADPIDQLLEEFKSLND